MTGVVLKPCPFCGKVNADICGSFYEPKSKEVFAVSCRTVECHGTIFSLGYGLFASREAAIKAWNTRAPASSEVREALEWIEKQDRYWTAFPNDNEVLEKSITGNVLIRGLYGRRAHAALRSTDQAKG